MRTTRLCCVLFAISFAGCLPPRLLANRDRAHIAAEEAEVVAWCQSPSDETKVEKCRVKVVPGDVIAPQEQLVPQVFAP